MKVGDLIATRHKWLLVEDESRPLGFIIKVEENYYRHDDYPQHRLTILWLDGGTSIEPSLYVEVISTAQEK